ncbi:type I methionyl aminopeptidase [Candidatus Nomurabacteria bacterium]|uniref:Methionine aminopeptidase n=1 Tax=candidate division WWE3 bacterium TaxID=2053526 RepID=A0A955E0H2_UNCKA|nr:type I methionyl aminopeptidase [candidate division WWE3 bacterium]MCB9823762.1 type I methionyl aminopeptidase [Candidatus Nomurabacteria bacterium]MCB9826832.1 type I methionyl aminopeptidase [Candidatus Nomurabacteria bacterium]MCB9827557.1 type I methionyl aminopeptidase [Candidatus Nomurabacteria bacterium]HXK52418.1 type I methionyl aminopeptidase [bacterium]
MGYSKSNSDIEKMTRCGRISAGAMSAVLSNVRAGVSLIELDSVAADYISGSGAKASFMTVDNYRFTTCINVNEGIVHGLPNDYRLKDGDIVSIDLGALYLGFHTDLSHTVEVGTSKESEFLSAGKEGLEKAISKAVEGNRLGDISFEMQSAVEKHGWSVSRDLVGHGIGKQLHEDPYVPCYGKPGKGMKLKENMVLAIEIIYQKGKPELALERDDWTYRTLDGSLSGLFEHTVVVGKTEPKILTVFN